MTKKLRGVNWVIFWNLYGEYRSTMLFTHYIGLFISTLSISLSPVWSLYFRPSNQASFVHVGQWILIQSYDLYSCIIRQVILLLIVGPTFSLGDKVTLGTNSSAYIVVFGGNPRHIVYLASIGYKCTGPNLFPNDCSHAQIIATYVKSIELEPLGPVYLDRLQVQSSFLCVHNL